MMERFLKLSINGMNVIKNNFSNKYHLECRCPQVQLDEEKTKMIIDIPIE
jgi:hypothetical protein